jgi:hypothetical protein
VARKQPQTKGLAGAEAMVKELAFLTSANIGADFLADQPRTPNVGSKKAPTHEQVLGYLDEGGRSLYPSEADSVKAGEIIRDNIAKQLKKVGQTTSDAKFKGRDTSKPVRVRVKTSAEQALAGAASGLKKGAKYLAKKMTERIKAGSTTSGAKASEVTKSYARQRKSNYSVNEAVVYIASGQLANAIASGKVKIYLKDANIGNLLKNI